MGIANYLFERERGMLPSETEWSLMDEDGDWWVSDCGDLFTLINDGGEDGPDTFSRSFAETPLDDVIRVHGIVDDGKTFEDVRADPVEALIQEVGTLIEESRYVTKDSGVRAVFASGMQRDTEAGKARFDLLIPNDVPYADQFLTRCADLMGRGAVKYEDRNWEQADSHAELARMKSSALRHFMQWINGERDEDHAAGAFFNMLAHETTEYKINHGITNREAA